MTIITIDDELINEIIAVSHYENPQEAVIKILSNYLQEQKKEQPLKDNYFVNYPCVIVRYCHQALRCAIAAKN